jgi:hypothetical protein
VGVSAFTERYCMKNQVATAGVRAVCGQCSMVSWTQTNKEILTIRCEGTIHTWMGRKAERACGSEKKNDEVECVGILPERTHQVRPSEFTCDVAVSAQIISEHNVKNRRTPDAGYRLRDRKGGARSHYEKQKKRRWCVSLLRAMHIR